MLTITTTGRIAQLRDRALQAETALAAPNLQLEDAREELRTRDLESHSARADLQTAQSDSGQSLVAKTKASEAVTRLLLKDASERLADQNRTITELRAELEQARASQPADPALPEHAVMAFRTLGGGLVTLLAVPDEDRYDRHPIYGYQCLTCGDEASGAFRMKDGRRWANEHAAVCRAIPTGTAAGKAGVRS
ncbi:hypothetical protein [Kitasatospora sp. HPMI-4]|uniref:hypothetical protein n=1 Tax=Kitasatospora sp. HPMI-4 TaxID=3448443 RepID=UPI003F1DD1DB